MRKPGFEDTATRKVEFTMRELDMLLDVLDEALEQSEDFAESSLIDEILSKARYARRAAAPP
jgi:hypothetical protein